MANDLDLLQISEWSRDATTDDTEQDDDTSSGPSKKMFCAVDNNNIEAVRVLLKNNPDLVNCTDKDSYTPLHRACYNNFVEMADLLLQYGANVHAETVDKWQPLHSACRWNSVDCCALLMQHAANPNAISQGGQTPLHIAASQSTSYEVIQLLLMNPLIDANLKNSVNETAFDIAKRSVKYFELFNMAKDLYQPIRN